MDILLISDSHGSKKRVQELVEKIKPSHLFFMGDGIGDVEDLNGVEARKVRGNCDLFCSDAETIIENFENHKIMITHGHKFKAKYLLDPMLQYARENACDILIFGHTHKRKAEFVDGIYVVNPGAFKNGDYAILKLQKDSYIVNFFNIKD